jgi:hypothetical protein
MVQPVRGGIPQLGCFFRGASQVVQPRTLRGIGRFLLGLLFAAFDRTVAGICDAVADAPTAAALREFLRSKALTPKLARLLDWKTRQLIRKARCRASHGTCSSWARATALGITSSRGASWCSRTAAASPCARA